MAKTMVFNLDSEIQLAQWRRLYEAEPDLWSGRVGALDTVRQGEPSSQEWFAGVLRTAVLFSPQIVLTDAQLLDGVFFQAFGAAGTLELIGTTLSARPSLQVRTRGLTLEESLRIFATAADGQHLSDVIWSSVLASMPSGTESASRLKALGGRPCARVASAPAGSVAIEISSALEQGLQLRRGALAGLASAWQSWFDAEAAGLVETATMALPNAELFEARMRRHLTPLASRLAPELLEVVLQQANRSRARGAIDSLAIDDQQRKRLHDAYAVAYSLALSESCDADVWLKVRQEAEGEAPGGLSGVGGHLALSGQATSQLGGMTPARFQSFRYEARFAIAAWQAKAEPATTKELAYQVRVASEVGDVASKRRGVLTRAVVVAVLAFVAFVLDLIPELDGRWTVLSLGAALLFGVLPEAVSSWREYRHLGDKDLSSVIELSGRVQ